MVFLLHQTLVGGAISPENRDPLFRITLEKPWSLKGAETPKKEARPKGPGITLLVALQYSQKSLKNNGFFEDFSPTPGPVPGAFWLKSAEMPEQKTRIPAPSPTLLMQTVSTAPMRRFGSGSWSICPFPRSGIPRAVPPRSGF
jgi:hypothetical protein